MKLLFAIPHYFASEPGQPQGSLGGQRSLRVEALTRCISALHELFGCNQHAASLTDGQWLPANAVHADSMEVVVCTSQARHVLADVPLPKDWYREVPCDCNPASLGFECHAVLKERLGAFDYYCYLEDDLVLHDPWWFVKLRRFNELFGNDALLQPNRFEVAQDLRPEKLYIDGDLPERLTAPYQDLGDRPQVELECLGVSVSFRRTRNPHSGCFFLNAGQMEHWARQPYFFDRDVSFVGPLESAATLGIMRAFRVYKPTAIVASFLEIEHCGDRWIQRLEAARNRPSLRKSAHDLGPQSILVSACAKSHPIAEPVRPPMQSLWIGKVLSTMERLSIASFLAMGHPVHLYAYGELENIPEGTTVMNAGPIVPESEIFVYEKGIGKGSYAAFSDLFRYKLLLEKGGWWVDLDVVALRPFEYDRPYVFGYEGTNAIGSAVFRAPAGCELLRCCYEEADQRRGNIEWGEIGPELLTRAVSQYRLTWAAEPRAMFHPVDWRQVPQLILAGGQLSRRSLAVHLIRHVWRWQKQDPDGTYPGDSLYERLKTRYLGNKR